MEECQKLHAERGYEADPHDQYEYESFDQNLEILLTLLSNFKERPPFTLQRVCELLTSDKEVYGMTHQYMFAFEKCLNISVCLATDK